MWIKVQGMMGCLGMEDGMKVKVWQGIGNEPSMMVYIIVSGVSTGIWLSK